MSGGFLTLKLVLKKKDYGFCLKFPAFSLHVQRKFTFSSVRMLSDSGCSYNVLGKLIALLLGTVDGPLKLSSLATYICPPYKT
jgi:hypothetical protein